MSVRTAALEFHPASMVFPLLDEDALRALADDISEHGLREAIKLDVDGKVVDGRNRLAACTLAEVSPRFETLPEGTDIFAYVVSENLRRRQLTPSQCGMCAARAREVFDERARKQQLEAASRGGEASGATRRGESKVLENFPEPSDGYIARDQAGEAFGVSGKTVDMATKVIERGTEELAAAVDSGKLSVSRAAKLADMPPEEQIEAISKPKGEKPSSDNGKSISFSDALAMAARKSSGLTAKEFAELRQAKSHDDDRKRLAGSCDSQGFHVSKDDEHKDRYIINRAIHVAIPGKRAEISDADAIQILFERQEDKRTKHAILARLRMDEDVFEKSMKDFKRGGMTVGEHVNEMLQAALNSLHGVVQQYRGNERSLSKVAEEQATELIRVQSAIESAVKDVEEILLKGLNNGISKKQ